MAGRGGQVFVETDLNQARLRRALFFVCVAVLGFSFFDGVEGDLRYYHTLMGPIVAGEIPYQHRLFEYPPYFFLFMLLPSLLRAWDFFFSVFVLQMLVIDAVAKAALLGYGARWAERRLRSTAPGDWVFARSLLPFLTASAVAILGQYYYLKRFDLGPATLVFFSLLLFDRGSLGVAGALLGVAIGAKAYPIVVLPALSIFAWRERRLAAFLTGLALALAPLALLALFVPWWHFASFHARRGLQAESLYASLVWLAHYFGLAHAYWKNMIGWMEVGGLTAEHVLPFARGVFALATLASLSLSARYAYHARQSVETLATAALGALLGFIAFNLVLSPQYLIWLAAPAALVVNTRLWRVSAAIVIAAAMTLSFFPDRFYFSTRGLALTASVGLVLRNLVLVYAWAALMRELLLVAAAKDAEPADVEAAPARS